MPLASDTPSGLTPYLWQARNFPLLPTPHWISSKSSIAPNFLQSPPSAFKNSFAAGVTPLSPCTGSTRTAATSSPICAANESASLNLAYENPSKSGAKLCWILYCAVAATAPSVRPWKQSTAVTILHFTPSLPATFTPWSRAALMSASFASVPELQKNILPPPISPTSFSARSAWTFVR